MIRLPDLIRFAVPRFLALILLPAAAGCGEPAPYDGRHPASQVGRELSIHGTFNGPGVQADYVTSAGEAVYLDNRFFTNIARPAYGSEVFVRGVLRFRTYPHSSEQHPSDYYYMDHGTLEVMPPSGARP